MTVELVDPVEWSQLREEIDEAFGAGATQMLRGDMTPVVIRSEEHSTYFLIPTKWTKKLEISLQDFEVKSLGVRLGERTKGQFIIGLAVIEKIGEFTRNKIIVSRRGAESFTYGRAILKESLIKIPPGLERGQKVVVYNEEGQCVGIGVLTVDSNKVGRLQPDRLVAKNLVDIGLYIRLY